MTRNLPILLSATLLSGILAGCGAHKNPPITSAQGKVTIDGKPIKGFAKIVFVSAADANSKAVGNVDPSGNYTVSNVPQGACKVGLQPINSPPPGPPPAGGPAPGTIPPAQNFGPFAEIHPKLVDPNKSGKQVEITEQSNTIDIDFSTK